MKNSLRMAATSEESSSPLEEKTLDSQVETVKTNERVPGHPAYYEKDGLRTYGDDEDHDHEPPVRRSLCHSSRTAANNRWVEQMSFRRMMSLIAMAFLWTGSQIPVYIFGTNHLLSRCII